MATLNFYKIAQGLMKMMPTNLQKTQSESLTREHTCISIFQMNGRDLENCIPAVSGSIDIHVGYITMLLLNHTYLNYE